MHVSIHIYTVWCSLLYLLCNHVCNHIVLYTSWMCTEESVFAPRHSNLHQGIWVPRFGGLRGCSSFSGICHTLFSPYIYCVNMCKHIRTCTSCHVCVYTVHTGRTHSHSKCRETAFERALKMYIDLCSVQRCVHNPPTNRTHCAFMCCVNSCERRHSRKHSTHDTLNIQLNIHELYETSTYHELNESSTWINESYMANPQPKQGNGLYIVWVCYD